MKFISFPYNWPLAENGQPVNIRWILSELKDDNTLWGMHPPIRCTDYFNDIVMYRKTNDTKLYTKYGFNLTPALTESAADRLRLVIFYPPLTGRNIIDYKIIIKETMHRLDAIIGATTYPLEEIEIPTEPDKESEVKLNITPGLALQLDPKWLSLPALISFYVKTIRAAIGMREYLPTYPEITSPADFIFDVWGNLPEINKYCFKHFLPINCRWFNTFVSFAPHFVDAELSSDYILDYDNVHNQGCATYLSIILNLSGDLTRWHKALPGLESVVSRLTNAGLITLEKPSDK